MKDNGNKDLREGEAARFNIDALRAIMKNSKDALSAAKISTNPNYVGENIASTGVGKGDHVKGFLNPNTESIYVRVSSSIDLKQGATFGIGTVVGDTNLEPQSPLVSRTAPLPLHQSNVDVAATFGVSLSTVGDLKVLITDIDAGKYEELLSGMTNDKRKVVFDALGAMCDLIKVESASRPGLEFDGTRNETSVSVTIHTSSPKEEVLIHSIDDVATLFGVPLNSLKDIDEFTKDLENRWDTFLNMQKIAPTVDDNLSGEVSPNDTNVQSVDINTKSISYAGDAGTSAKDQPKVNSNFCHLVADLVFDGFNIYIPCKVVEKSRSSFDRCLIEVNSEADLVDVVTIGIPSLTGYGFTKETIRVEYEWRPPRCDICKIFGHVHDHCPKKVVSPPIVTTSNVVTPNVEKSTDGFQTMGKKKKRKGKSKSNNGGSVKQTIRYEPKVTTSAPKKGTTNEGNASISSSMLKTTGASSKKDNISTSNTFSALNDDEEDEDKVVENVYDESDNLFPNTKTGGNSSFTVAYG
ncbi:hypothetical protein Tco_0559250 [Tanacetum coccineum]